jgi:cation diffusion facilitator CzcD-associated flavoprotein CzcO
VPESRPDQLADWLESYAKTFELDVWNESTIKTADYDEEKKVWNIEIVKADGSKRLMYPRHFIVASGIGAPKMPKIPHVVGSRQFLGAKAPHRYRKDEFQGEILHSSAYATGKVFTGKRILVVGAGVSGIFSFLFSGFIWQREAYPIRSP